MELSSVKRACICALCTALCYVLPLAFHALGMGSTLLPMHLPVLLCGLICGAGYGAFCGIAGPVVSCVLSGMPTALQLASMAPELCAYGLLCGLLYRHIRTGKIYPDLYCALLPAMLLGRVLGGLCKMLVYLATAGDGFTMTVWLTTYFVQTLPGTILQLLVIPTIVFALTRAGLIPARYPRQKEQENQHHE
mgnify:FL=1